MPRNISEAEFAEKKAEITQQKEFHEMLRAKMYEVNKYKINATAVGHVFLSFLTAPLLTLSTSLQVSMPMNKLTLENLSSGAKSTSTRFND